MYHGGGPMGGGRGHGGGPSRGQGGAVWGRGGPSGRHRLRSAIDADTDEDLILGKVYDSKVLGRMPRYLAPIKGWLALGLGGSVVRTLAQAGTPWLVKEAVDRFILTGNVSGLNLIVIAFVAVSLAMWGGQYLQTLYLAYHVPGAKRCQPATGSAHPGRR